MSPSCMNDDCTTWHSSHQEVESMYVSFPWFSVTAWPTGYDRSDAMWLPRLVLKGHAASSHCLQHLLLDPRATNWEVWLPWDWQAGGVTGRLYPQHSQLSPVGQQSRQSDSHLQPSSTVYLPAGHHWVMSERIPQPSPVQISNPQTWDIVKWVLLKATKFLSSLLYNNTYLEKHIP